MIKVFYGEKGTGKTKAMVEKANSILTDNKGDVVFIDDTNQLMLDLNHKIRFVNVSNFPVCGTKEFLAFICGILSANYDINTIFLERVIYITKTNADQLEELFSELHKISDERSVDFVISISGKNDSVPHFIKQYAS
jgi:RecA/RadA recombinase